MMIEGGMRLGSARLRQPEPLDAIAGDRGLKMS
jgi:hypothetical protein